MANRRQRLKRPIVRTPPRRLDPVTMIVAIGIMGALAPSTAGWSILIGAVILVILRDRSIAEQCAVALAKFIQCFGAFVGGGVVSILIIAMSMGAVNFVTAGLATLAIVAAFCLARCAAASLAWQPVRKRSQRDMREDIAVALLFGLAPGLCFAPLVLLAD